MATTFPLLGSGVTTASPLMYAVTYQLFCPGVAPVGSVLKSPTVKLSKSSLNNTCALAKCAAKRAVAMQSNCFFIIITFLSLGKYKHFYYRTLTLKEF